MTTPRRDRTQSSSYVLFAIVALGVVILLLAAADVFYASNGDWSNVALGIVLIVALGAVLHWFIRRRRQLLERDGYVA